MNITSAIDSSAFLFQLYNEKITIEGSGESELISSTTTTTTIPSTTHIVLRLFNTTARIFSLTRPGTTTTSSALSNKFFLFNSSFNRTLRYGELAILSLTLPLYAVVLILLIELTVQRISSNTTISGGESRSRSQRRRQRMRSLIWTSNYLLVDFFGLLYELIYVIIHLTGDLALNSLAGRFYCQLQVYLQLYLTVLMAYSLTAISVYRRRHFLNLNNETTRTTSRSMILIIALWIMPIVTSLMPAYLLIRFKSLQIIQHETTNECQISYTYGSTVVAIYMCYRLGNIFLLPLSVSFACYLTICIDLIRMQRSFNRTFKRHVHIRKNLILQILFLFLNFAVFWLPAEIITLYTKNRLLKDTVQVTKSLNILLDPLIIIGFDTRFKSAANQLLSRWSLDEFILFFRASRQNTSSNASIQLMTSRTGASIKRLKQSTLRRTTQRPPTQKRQTSTVSWNIANDDDITVIESTSNHVSVSNEQRSKTLIQSTIRRNQQKRRRHQPQSIPHRHKPPARRPPNKTTSNHTITTHV